MSIDLVGTISMRKEVKGNGDKQLQFPDLHSGIFNYTFELWAIDNSVGNDKNPTLGALFTITKMFEVHQLKIKIAID